eukprot:gb/GEZN01001676.1/.p1 GENE.gb/GEZN01001676.1/~~gb/GEZN01001676.1/.p1  ORF type:complete len:937 (-),score=190.53 gb/GEZN01001676.1/:75-2819(-)
MADKQEKPENEKKENSPRKVKRKLSRQDLNNASFSQEFHDKNQGLLELVAEDECQQLGQEKETGNVEYKWKLVGKDRHRIKRLITQMNYRLTEGKGEAIYELGVLDTGHPLGVTDEELIESILLIKRMAGELRCEVLVLRVAKGEKGKLAEVLVRKLSDGDFIDVRVSVLGNQGSGKSTLVGVLASGKLDDGKGLARMNVFRHRHEMEAGSTSSISRQILGFDGQGNVTNSSTMFGLASWAEIVEDSNKVLTFLDLAGNERHFKTTLDGLLGHQPDYVMVVVPAEKGITRIMKEHLGVSLALKIPLFIALTKIDIVTSQALQSTLKKLQTLLAEHAHKQPELVMPGTPRPELAERALKLASTCPIFPISSVDGKGLSELKTFLFHIPKHKDWSLLQTLPAHAVVMDHFEVNGVGPVAASMVLQGIVQPGDELLLGPDPTGQFSPVKIASIHLKRAPAKRALAGQTVTFAFEDGEQNVRPRRDQLRKGVSLVHQSLGLRACVGFEAKIRVLHHPTSIQSNYEPTLHVGSVRQTATLVASDVASLRTGARARVRFMWRYWPELVADRAHIIFHEGRTRGVGVVNKLLYEEDVPEAKEQMRKRREGRKSSSKQHRTGRSPFKQNASPGQPIPAFDIGDSKQSPAPSLSSSVTSALSSSVVTASSAVSSSSSPSRASEDINASGLDSDLDGSLRDADLLGQVAPSPLLLSASPSQASSPFSQPPSYASFSNSDSDLASSPSLSSRAREGASSCLSSSHSGTNSRKAANKKFKKSSPPSSVAPSSPSEVADTVTNNGAKRGEKQKTQAGGGRTAERKSTGSSKSNGQSRTEEQEGEMVQMERAFSLQGEMVEMERAFSLPENAEAEVLPARAVLLKQYALGKRHRERSLDKPEKKVLGNRPSKASASQQEAESDVMTDE